MTRAQWLLLTVIAAELAAGGYLVARLRRPTPPIPDLAAVDLATAEEIRGLAADCRTAEQWAGLGEVYLATGFFPEAEACLSQASALDRASADLAFKHGFALERLGKAEEANARYEAAAGLNHPRAADCWYYIGKNHLRLERDGPAAAAFERAGNLPGARYELALLNARSGRVAEAEAEARRLADEFPNAYPPVSLRYRLALARADRPAADALADLFTRRRRPLPTPFDSEHSWVTGVRKRVGRDRLFAEARQEVLAGRLAEAEAKLRSAQAAGWDPAIADKLAEVVFVRGRPKEAGEILAEAVARGRPSWELLWRLGQAHDALGQPARALELWERAAVVATGPGAQGLWDDLATRYDKAGEREKARAFHARAHMAAGSDELDAGRLGAAVEALSRAVKESPRLAQAWYLLGEVHRLNGRSADARSAYEQCLRVDPDHGRARRALTLLGE
ncbi:MAG: tetratricopeptide repeat protein [Gemmataceae bacterium]|nr:tetratricopeptide repeat protein [Gemmataceae bacterium]